MAVVLACTKLTGYGGGATTWQHTRSQCSEVRRGFLGEVTVQLQVDGQVGSHPNKGTVGRGGGEVDGWRILLAKGAAGESPREESDVR